MSITTTQLPYEDGQVKLTGVLVGHDGEPNRRPRILLVHGGAGLDDHALGQARRYAALRYIVFAADMFGAGDRERVMECVLALRDDPELLDPADGRRAGRPVDDA